MFDGTPSEAPIHDFRQAEHSQDFDNKKSSPFYQQHEYAQHNTGRDIDEFMSL